MEDTVIKNKTQNTYTQKKKKTDPVLNLLVALGNADK